MTAPNKAQTWSFEINQDKNCPLDNRAIALNFEDLNLLAHGFCRGQLILPGIVTEKSLLFSINKINKSYYVALGK